MRAKQPLTIVVGPGRRFGAELCLELGRSGYELILLVRGMNHWRETVARLIKSGIRVQVMEMDLTDEQSIIRTFANLREQDKLWDLLMYNAKSSHKGDLLQMEYEYFNEDLKVNGSAALSVVQQALKCGCREGAQILFTGGNYALNPNPAKIGLSVGKAALYSIYQICKQTLEPGIKVKYYEIAGKVGEEEQITPGKWWRG